MGHIFPKIPPGLLIKHVNVFLDVRMESALSLNLLTLGLQMALLLPKHGFKPEVLVILTLDKRVLAVLNIEFVCKLSVL